MTRAQEVAQLRTAVAAAKAKAATGKPEDVAAYRRARNQLVRARALLSGQTEFRHGITVRQFVDVVGQAERGILDDRDLAELEHALDLARVP